LAVETAHLFVQVIQIQNAVYASQKMITSDMRLAIKLVEQSGMNLLRSKHHKNPPDPHNPMESEACAPIKHRAFQQHQLGTALRCTIHQRLL
jgi:hypothetical protein